jgi:hypothetical protein
VFTVSTHGNSSAEGIKANVIERFAEAAVPKANVSFSRDTYTFNFPGAQSKFVDTLNYYGPP